MRRFLLRLVGAAVCIGPALAPAADKTQASVSALAAIEREHTQLFEAVAPSVVFIGTPDGFGSGFFVSSNGHVLTNRHVVGSQKQVRVVLQDGRRLTGKVVATGQDGLDLAIVKVELRDSKPLAVRSSKTVRIGAWVGSVGHGHGGIWTLSTGFVSNAWGDTRTGGVLQTQIPLNPGASGGPVFDRHGAVVGIVTAGLAEAQAINFAIRTDTAIQRLPYLRSLVDCLVVEAEAGASIQLDGQFVGKGPEVALFVEPGKHTVSTVVGGRRLKERVDFPRQRVAVLRAD